CPPGVFRLFSPILALPPAATVFPYTTLFRSRTRPAFVAHLPRRVFSPHPLLRQGVPGVGQVCNLSLPPCNEPAPGTPCRSSGCRSDEHTSELQSLTNLVCRLLLGNTKTQPPA